MVTDHGDQQEIPPRVGARLQTRSRRPRAPSLPGAPAGPRGRRSLMERARQEEGHPQGPPLASPCPPSRPLGGRVSGARSVLGPGWTRGRRDVRATSPARMVFWGSPGTRRVG